MSKTTKSKKGAGVSFTLRINPDVLEKLKVKAEEEGRSPNNLIGWILAKATADDQPPTNQASEQGR